MAGPVELTLLSYVTESAGWTPVHVDVPVATPTDAYAQIDLSSYLVPVGPRRVLALLKVFRTSGLGDADVSFGFRTPGLTNSWVEPSLSPQGCSAVTLSSGYAGRVLVLTDTKAFVEWAIPPLMDPGEVTVELMGYLDDGSEMVVIFYEPIGSVLTRPGSIRCRVTQTNVIVPALTEFYIVDPLGERHDIILAGAWQAGWAGSLSYTGDHTCDITVMSWPTWFEEPRLWTFIAGCYG